MSEAFDPDWLALRESADHAARSVGAAELLSLVAPALPSVRPARIVDVGCGIGSNVRWLAPRLPRPQHWVLVDHDAALLERALLSLREHSTAVLSAKGRRLPVSDLRTADLADVDLVTGSALLDVLTGPELAHLVAVCTSAGTPMLLALSVDGDVELDPALPEDGLLREAFHAHQRRDRDAARRLGPDAAGVARRLLRAHGCDVHAAQTPWSLGAADAALAVAWHDGWVAAAAEERPDLAVAAAHARAVRRNQAGHGELRVRVGHVDLLALPGPGS